MRRTCPLAMYGGWFDLKVNMANEQAESSALESNDLAGLASFLSDTPEESEQEDEEATAEESTSDGDTEDSANDEQDVDPENPDGDEEDAPTPIESKVTIKVKNEDGEIETLELTQEEIAKSYMRQRDYTAKTTALAKRENEAVEFLRLKNDEIRQQYLTQAEVARAAVIQMAGIKSEAEMAQLANSDPAAWVAEQQRQRQISNYLSQLDQQINGEKQAAEQQRTQLHQQHLQEQYKKAWDDLSKDGIDKPKLQKIYGDVNKNYGFSNEELANVYDSRLVRMMKDAAAYRELQAQKPSVKQKLQDAPRMPSKQSSPAQERRDQALEQKFKSGRAKLNDLAAFLR
jgi:hypothetical protein